VAFEGAAGVAVRALLPGQGPDDERLVAERRRGGGGEREREREREREG